MKPEEKEVTIARCCHEVNRVYCNSLGDMSQAPWDESPAWQRESAIKGVQFILDHPNLPDPEAASHESWMAEKKAAGWKHGPIKDAEKKEHPCMVEYQSLPIDQRFKDSFFVAIVNVFR